VGGKGLDVYPFIPSVTCRRQVGFARDDKGEGDLSWKVVSEPEESWACGPPKVMKTPRSSNYSLWRRRPLLCHPGGAERSAVRSMGNECQRPENELSSRPEQSAVERSAVLFDSRLVLSFLVATRNPAGLKAHNSPLTIPVTVNPGIPESPTNIPVPILAHQVCL